MPSPGLLRTVCAYLDERRLIATELYVIAPTYVPVSITLQVLAQPDADTGDGRAGGGGRADDVSRSARTGGSTIGDPGTGGRSAARSISSTCCVAALVTDVIRVADLVITLNGTQAPACTDAPIPAGALLTVQSVTATVTTDPDGYGVGRMISAAPFRNPPPGPPNDPTWMLLEGRDGWPMAPASDRSVRSRRSIAPGAAKPARRSVERSPIRPAASAALSPPPNVALAARRHSLAARSQARQAAALRRLRLRLRRCSLHRRASATARGSWLRRRHRPARPRHPVLDGGRLGRRARARVRRHGFALRAIWQPPTGAVPQPWQPSAIAVAPDGRDLVADIANGAMHVFDRGGTWRAAWTGFGAVAAIAVDRFGRIYTSGLRANRRPHLEFAPAKQIALATDVDAVRDCFAPLAEFASDSAGRINLAGALRRRRMVRLRGPCRARQRPRTPPTFAPSASWLSSSALDSRIGRCQWHRVVLKLELPRGTIALDPDLHVRGRAADRPDRRAAAVILDDGPARRRLPRARR